MLLHNCTKLCARDNPEDIQKVYITPDLTPREQQHNEDLRIQLAEKSKNGKKYFIKKRQDCAEGGLKPSLCTHSMHHTLTSTALHCFLTNSQSISNKLSELRALVAHSDYHVIGITESWCNYSISDGELCLKGYNLFRADKRSGTGGGVLLSLYWPHCVFL